MLKLSLAEGEYLTIGEDVVVQVYHTEGGRAYLAIDAPRSLAVVRGAVLERSGAAKPRKLAQVPGKRRKSEAAG